MKKKIKKLFSFLIKPVFIFLFLAILLRLTTEVSWAQEDCFNFKIIFPFGELTEGEFNQIDFSFYVRDHNSQYLIHSSDNWPYQYYSGWVEPVLGKIYPKAIRNEKLLRAGEHALRVERKDIGGDYCSLSYTVLPQQVCRLTTPSTGSPGYTSSDTISVTGTDVPSDGDIYKVIIDPGGKEYGVTVSGNSFSHALGKFNNGTYTVTLLYLIDSHPPKWERANCQTAFTISSTGGGEAGSIDYDQHDICQGNIECAQCFNEGKAWTALGCIPTGPTELIKWAFPYLLGFGGLAAFLLIVFAGIQIMTSSGNPEKLKAGKELITSAITGLIFIILSLFLLRVIGVDILHIPGLE